MNDRHPSGVSFPADPAADFSYGSHGGTYDASRDQQPYDAYGQQDPHHAYPGRDFGDPGAAYGGGDPLYDPLPGDTSATATGQWDTGAYGDVSYGTGQWDTTAWTQAPARHADGGWDGSWDGGWDTGSHDTVGAGWDTGSHGTVGAGWDTGSHGTVGAGWDTGGNAAYGWGPDGWESGAYGTVGAADTAVWDTGAYAAAEFENPVPEHGHEPAVPQEEPPAPPAHPGDGRDGSPLDSASASGDGVHGTTASPSEAPVRPAGPRGRRRSAKPKRSALIAVAVPSACVMGVTAVAAASVGIDGGGEETTRAAEAPVEPSAANSKLDAQIAGLSADAESFADRASRTQERLDLQAREEAERKRRAAEAARREALRPKFALPVAQQGLSAYYGQAGLNWMSLHTGVDFPVGYGTPVMAATDGTITTQWNDAYGNMAVVTAPDGTETWYCHLSSTKIRSGSVKAGDTIGYSGNSGNSTGPHLHFEVRPGGGSAVDPLPWFRSHGLDPT